MGYGGSKPPPYGLRYGHTVGRGAPACAPEAAGASPRPTVCRAQRPTAVGADVPDCPPPPLRHGTFARREEHQREADSLPYGMRCSPIRDAAGAAIGRPKKMMANCTTPLRLAKNPQMRKKQASKNTRNRGKNASNRVFFDGSFWSQIRVWRVLCNVTEAS